MMLPYSDSLSLFWTGYSMMNISSESLEFVAWILDDGCLDWLFWLEDSFDRLISIGRLLGS